MSAIRFYTGLCLTLTLIFVSELLLGTGVVKNTVLVTSLSLVLAVVPSPVNGKTTVTFDPCPGLGKGVRHLCSGACGMLGMYPRCLVLCLHADRHFSQASGAALGCGRSDDLKN